MQEKLLETPEKIKALDSPELSDRVAHMQTKIEQGVASDNDYLEFIICQLELADRGILNSD